MTYKKPYQKSKDDIQYSKFILKERDMEQNAREFSYMLDVDKIPASGTELDLTADEKQREALAKRFGLNAVVELRAKAVLNRVNRKRVRMKASFDAKVVQECVVTLKPFEQRVSDEFVVIFSSEDEPSVRKNEIDLDMSEEDDIEYVDNEKVDIGELIAEYFSLALDPFPRSPDAVFREEEDEENEKNAFSVLEKLKFK